jgi:hypothetical protein
MLRSVWREAGGQEIVIVRSNAGSVEQIAGRIARANELIGFVDEPHAGDAPLDVDGCIAFLHEHAANRIAIETLRRVDAAGILYLEVWTP